MVGLYYSVKTDQFAIFSGLIVPEIGEYKLVCPSLVAWMEEKILSAFNMASADKWGAAVIQFYRVRKCLETCGISENIDTARRYGTIL